MGGKMKEVLLLLVLFFLIAGVMGYAYILIQNESNIITIAIPQETMFRLALEYHGIDQAFIRRDVNCFYFMRDGQLCMLFTPAFERWVLQQPLIDNYYKEEK